MIVVTAVYKSFLCIWRFIHSIHRLKKGIPKRQSVKHTAVSLGGTLVESNDCEKQSVLTKEIVIKSL